MNYIKWFIFYLFRLTFICFTCTFNKKVCSNSSHLIPTLLGVIIKYFRFVNENVIYFSLVQLQFIIIVHMCINILTQPVPFNYQPLSLVMEN